jgi:hypothetical protein
MNERHEHVLLIENENSSNEEYIENQDKRKIK